MRTYLLGIMLCIAATSGFAAGEALTVYKSPTCGCCREWVDYMKQAGFSVKVVEMPNVAPIKEKLGVPRDLASCHTAVLESSGQVIEGHVPVAAVRKLIAQPAVKGVAVPGMPQNSPGMGVMDGNLTTVDFSGRNFSRD